MTSRLARGVMAGGAVLGIACVSLLPQPWKGRMATHGIAHECAHVAAFNAAFFLTTWGERRLFNMGVAGLLLLLFGAALEALQTRVYGNLLEYHDIAANGAGIALGLVIRGAREG